MIQNKYQTRAEDHNEIFLSIFSFPASTVEAEGDRGGAGRSKEGDGSRYAAPGRYRGEEASGRAPPRGLLSSRSLILSSEGNAGEGAG